MQALARLSISQRISSALGILLALLVMLGVVSWLNAGAVSRSAATVEWAAGVATTGGALAEALRDSVALSATYALTETDGDLAKVKQSEETLKEKVEATKAAMTSPDDSKRVAAITEAYAAYDEATKATLSAMGVRRAASADFTKASVAVNTIASATVLVLIRENSAAVLPSAIRLNDAQLAASAAAARYLASRDPAQAAT